MLVTAINTPNIIQSPVIQQSANILSETQREGVEEIATTTPVAVIDIKTATTTEDIKRITKEYFKDTPVLAEIARCESTYRQFGPEGTILRGKVNSADVGVLQINEKYHSARSKELGMDIHTLEGNLKYGALLYKEQGSRPWNASKPCWGSATVAANL